MIGVILPDAGKEIIKGANARGITESEAAEDGVKGRFPKHATPNRDGSDLELQGKQVRAEHTGRKAWLGSKNGVTILHNGISQGKIPELHDIIPGAFRKRKRIRIKIKELGYESILIGGMSAGITR